MFAYNSKTAARISAKFGSHMPQLSASTVRGSVWSRVFCISNGFVPNEAVSYVARQVATPDDKNGVTLTLSVSIVQSMTSTKFCNPVRRTGISTNGFLQNEAVSDVAR